ncbi:hypothetical protein BH11MYX3_BH11MYX3_03270 [soil metagenome]
MRAALVVLALASCGGHPSFTVAQKRATDRNAREHDRRHDELLLAAYGAPFTPPVAIVELNQEAMPTGGLVGLRPGEGIYAMPDGELSLMPMDCIRGSSCGCEVRREYSYLKKADGSVVVARLTPVVHVREIRVASCGTGCGQPPPPALRSAARLGVRQLSGIKFVETTYPYELVVTTCDHPVPAP